MRSLLRSRTTLFLAACLALGCSSVTSGTTPNVNLGGAGGGGGSGGSGGSGGGGSGGSAGTGGDAGSGGTGGDGGSGGDAGGSGGSGGEGGDAGSGGEGGSGGMGGVGGDPYSSPIPFSPWVELLPKGGGFVATSNVQVVDLDGSGKPQLLASEPILGQLTWLHDCNGDPTACTVDAITTGLTQPARVQVLDWDGDGDQDILVADIGILAPTDENVGRVVLLTNDGSQNFTATVLLDGVGRLPCAQAADLDGDGDLDIAVCVFGNESGDLRWLEQDSPGHFVSHILEALPGAIHAFPFDADGDGDLDIAAVISQDTEEVQLFRNDGKGNFEKETLFAGMATNYGSSGITLVDLDHDGDTDIVYTNGDEDGDDGNMHPSTWYGIAWLENDGKGNFTYHDILRFAGAYSAHAVDLDGDGDLDLVMSAVHWFQIPTDTELWNLVWLENDGHQNFTRHDISTAPDQFPRGGLITSDLVDFDGDGDVDIVAGPMFGSETPRLYYFENLTVP